MCVLVEFTKWISQCLPLFLESKQDGVMSVSNVSLKIWLFRPLIVGRVPLFTNKRLALGPENYIPRAHKIRLSLEQRGGGGANKTERRYVSVRNKISRSFWAQQPTSRNHAVIQNNAAFIMQEQHTPMPLRQHKGVCY
jgi:hypothetical protein